MSTDHLLHSGHLWLTGSPWRASSSPKEAWLAFAPFYKPEDEAQRVL